MRGRTAAFSVLYHASTQQVTSMSPATMAAPERQVFLRKNVTLCFPVQAVFLVLPEVI
jgi:hypothetical protein